jgi:hypothetical protein
VLFKEEVHVIAKMQKIVLGYLIFPPRKTGPEKLRFTKKLPDIVQIEMY